MKSDFRFSKIYKDSESCEFDAVCFGNSRGVNSFYTPSINNKNLSFYNFSYNGLNIENISALLKDFVDSKNKSNHVFIEISTIFNSNKKNSFSKLNLYSSISNRIAENIKDKDKKLYLTNRFLPIFKYNNELFYRALYYLNKSDQNWVNEYNISNALINEVNEMKEFEIQLNKNDLKELKNLLDFLEFNNINCTLYIAPYLANYRHKISNYDSIIKKVTTSLNYNVLDFSLLLDDYSCFADRVHTNKKGATIVTNKLIDNLVK